MLRTRPPYVCQFLHVYRVLFHQSLNSAKISQNELPSSLIYIAEVILNIGKRCKTLRRIHYVLSPSVTMQTSPRVYIFLIKLVPRVSYCSPM